MLVPSLIGEIRKNVDDYSSELFSLKLKAVNIRKSVCNLDDVIGMVQTSTQIQEQKAESLEAFSQKTEEFTAEAARIDEDAAAVIKQNKENFYNKYNYLKPDAEKSDWEEFWDDAAEWCKEHWQEIVTTVGIIVGAALAIAAVVTTGGAALVPLLTALGVAAGTAANISLAVAAIAVVSTIGAAALNIADTWGNIDNPIFNTLQSALNWTSTISNGLYSIGMLYNSIKYKFGGRFNHGSKGASGAEYRYNMVENPGPLVDIDANAAGTFRSGKYNVNVLEENTVYYRAGDSKSPLGQYFTTEPPSSVADVRINSAVKPQWIDPKTGALTGTSTIDTVYGIEIPKGTITYSGPAGYQGGIYLGGKEQIFIPKPWNIDGVKVISSAPLK